MVSAEITSGPGFAGRINGVSGAIRLYSAAERSKSRYPKSPPPSVVVTDPAFALISSLMTQSVLKFGSP